MKNESSSLKKGQFISVICVVFNGERTIEKTIQSIINQNYEFVEIIIVDGQSTDNTLTILNNYSKDINILISERDDGIYDAMNKGISVASGKWLYFIGCDDVLFNNNVLLDFVKHVDANQKTSLYYGNVILEPSEKKYGGKFGYSRLLKENICHQSIFYDRMIFEKVGMFNTNYKILADWDFNIRCFGNKEIDVKYFNLIIAKYHELGRSSVAHDVLFNKEFLSIIFKNLPLKYGIMFLVNKLLKRIQNFI